MNFSIQQLLNQRLKREENRKPQTTWHSSSLGSCLCGTYLARLGAKPDKEIDDRTLRVFKVGNIMEDFIIDTLKTLEDYEIETQNRFENTKFNLSGKFDLKIKNKQTGKELIYEIKSKHSRSFWYMNDKGQGAQLSHKMQLWTYLEANKIEEGRILYVSKDDLSLLEYPIFLNDVFLKELVEDQLEILNEAWLKQVAPKPAPQGTWMADYCNYHEQCLKQEKYLEKEPKFYQLEAKKLPIKNNKKILKI